MSWIVRIISVLLMTVLGFYLLLYVHHGIARAYGDMRLAMYGAGLVLWIYSVIGWTSIWYGKVEWTSYRKIGTIFAFIISLPIGYLLGIILSFGDKDFGWFLSAIFPIAAYIILTLIIWVRIPLDFFKRAPAVLDISCPKCGYNLRGLSEARCPECGGYFTLDQLTLRKAT